MLVDDFFTPSEAAAWGGYVSSHGRLNKLIEENLRRTAGLSHAEYEVLMRLFRSDEGRLRIQALAADSVLTHSGTSRLVDRLEGAGLVERIEATEDRRGAYASITAHGRKHFETTARKHHTFVRKLFLQNFTEDELQTMASFWDRLDL